jgi:cysteine sulfinate desulfinase/cysteine desulfurase-like protein
VLRALGIERAAALGTLRFSFGKLTSEQDVERLAVMLGNALEEIESAHPGRLSTVPRF